MNELFSAFGLQRGMGMKSILVGFVAAVALSGCGVGMDDPEGTEAATGQNTVGLVATTENTATAQADFRGPNGQDPRTALPQDPIPVYVGQSVPSAPGRPGK